ncbi:galactose oxidase-like domain-containing protein [Nostoc sp. C117]|uniref:galactose oxidase-like domain-containing protein n=1 Tax=Nostoc sp. C117 TaxID=3349875 RepID=UPI00370DC94D
MKQTRFVSVLLTCILVLTLSIYSVNSAIASTILGSKEEMGAWETVPLPSKDNLMQSVHTIVLPNGKVLSLNGSSFRTTLTYNDGKPNFQEGVTVKDYDVVNNTSLFDPETKKFERIASPPVIQYGETNDLFCSGHLQLLDGNIIFVSGTGRYYPGGKFTGSKQVNLYNWQTGKWSAIGQLQEGRWYPSLISLADGKIVIFSGLKIDAPNQINPSIEIYDPKTEKIQYIDLTQIENSPFNTKLENGIYDGVDLYPRVFPTADGKLLITGDEAGIANVLVPHNSKNSYLMSIHKDSENKLSVSFEVGPQRKETSKAYGTALQVPNSEDILLIGGLVGTNDINFGRGGKIDGFPKDARVASSLQRWISPQNSGEKNGKWEIVDNFLNKARANVQAVILPNKEILVVNGGEYPEYKPVYEPLLMTPNAEALGGYSIKSMNPANLPRLYHNGAVLLPDARVLITGGNANRVAREKDGTVHVDILRDPKEYYKFPQFTDKSGQVKEFSIEEYYKNPQSYFSEGDTQPFVPAEIWQSEIFSPPYLFKPGSRPEIQHAPDVIKYNQSGTISVNNATQKSSVVLIKLGSVTHSFDFGQRLADLPIENIALGEQSSIQFKTPDNANLYPPGYYMMFYLNDIGKPSHAKMVKLEA